MERYAELKQAMAESRTERAEELCREQLRAEPDNVELLSLAGALARGRGGTEEACADFSRAASLDPGRAELHNNLGVILQDLGRQEEAVRSYREALHKRPAYPEALCNLGNALQKLGRSEEAIGSYSDAIALDPGYTDAYYNLGNTLRNQGEWQGAVECYRRVLALDPGRLPGWINLAGTLLALNEFDEAIALFRRALELDPESVDAHWNLALALLVTGDYRQGWREYQWRLKDPAARFEACLAGRESWDGSPLAGRTLFIRCEQGFGDAIQFFRYAQFLARRGEKVALECRRELLPLFSSQEGKIPCFAAGDPPPPFDVFTYLLSLPHLLGSTLEDLPAQEPPLRADPGLALSWRERMREGAVKVGVVWAGSSGYKNDRYRSLTAPELSPLLALPGVRFYSLQMDACAGELTAPGGGTPLCDLAAGIGDFSDTAAILENLDLVVSVDTAVAHLAAAMGKRVLLMLPFSCEWRWLSGRTDSPWYPSVRIYRQRSPGDWRSVVAAVAQDLLAGAERQPELKPERDEANLRFQKANALRAQGEYAQAAAAYRALLALLPDCAEVHNNLGLALQDQGCADEAAQSFRRALELNPLLCDAHNNLGTVLVSRGEHEQAEPCFRRALELDEGYLPAYVNLGSCLQVLEKPQQAVELYRRAIELDPSYLEARINLGTAWQDLMQPERAIAVYEEILRMAPGHPEAHWNLALSLLCVGEFERGWSEYEWRLADAAEGATPLWRGEELCGRSILVECEQGLGDTLQFVRYLHPVAQRGGKVFLQCQIPALKPLLSRVPGVEGVFSRGEQLPRSDFRVKLLSLPHIFGTTLDNMPAWRPYLAPDPKRAALWDLMLYQGRDLKVGLVWRGGPLPRNRACPFENFAPLSGLGGVSFYTLQLGEAPDQEILPVWDLAPQIHDFGDTAAILAGLDLLITVDTAAAHLAGGMGVPVWLMLPLSCDWRWFMEGEGSPWYPSLRIFRQEKSGDWPGVVGRLRGALEGLLSRR